MLCKITHHRIPRRIVRMVFQPCIDIFLSVRIGSERRHGTDKTRTFRRYRQHRDSRFIRVFEHLIENQKPVYAIVVRLDHVPAGRFKRLRNARRFVDLVPHGRIGDAHRHALVTGNCHTAPRDAVAALTEPLVVLVFHAPVQFPIHVHSAFCIDRPELQIIRLCISPIKRAEFIPVPRIEYEMRPYMCFRFKCGKNLSRKHVPIPP